MPKYSSNHGNPVLGILFFNIFLELEVSYFWEFWAPQILLPNTISLGILNVFLSLTLYETNLCLIVSLFLTFTKN